MSASESRHYLRARARALEGSGDDLAAAEGYGKFITFASQVKANCAACHSGVTAPKEMAWFRDWYAGRRFADCLARAGRLSAEIETQQTKLKSDPNNAAAQMKLAYLYEAQGKHTQAETLWARLNSDPSHVATSRNR